MVCSVRVAKNLFIFDTAPLRNCKEAGEKENPPGVKVVQAMKMLLHCTLLGSDCICSLHRRRFVVYVN